MSKILRTQFKLKSLKIKDGVPEINWLEFRENGAANGWEPCNKIGVFVPHEDLTNAFKELGPIAMRVMGWNEIEIVFSSPQLTDSEKEAANTLRHRLKLFKQGQLERIEVRGIHLNGKEDTAGFQVTIMRDSDSKVPSVINTPVVKFNRESFGIEERAAEIIDRISEEVFCYLFEEKYAPLTVAFEDELSGKNRKKAKKSDENQMDLVNEAAKAEQE